MNTGISFNCIFEELLHRIIERINVKENQDIVLHYRFKNPFEI